MGDDSYSDVETRRQQWITYYVATGQFEEARKLGWVGCRAQRHVWNDIDTPVDVMNHNEVELR